MIHSCRIVSYCHPFIFTDTPPTLFYTLSLHDALPILAPVCPALNNALACPAATCSAAMRIDAFGLRRSAFAGEDRKSTRLNSSHLVISYAVFCLKKKIYHTTLISYLVNNFYMSIAFKH